MSFVYVLMGFNFDEYRDLPIDLRKKYQIVGTPDWMCDFMVSKLPIDPHASYLDPCVGRGPLIKALLKAGVREDQITAYDIIKDNISYCQSVWKNVRYKNYDLMTAETHFDYVVGVPPWVRKLPEMLVHLTFLAEKKCVLLAPFFLGNSRYKKVEAMVNDFYTENLDSLVRFALAGSQHFGVPCVYEFKSHGAVGFSSLMVDWILLNDLGDYFTFDKDSSVPSKLVLLNGQEFFLPINPVWFLPYVYSGFKVRDVKGFDILGSFKAGRKCFGLAYGSQKKLDEARAHYSSIAVKKMLTCGQEFGWRHLRAV